MTKEGKERPDDGEIIEVGKALGRGELIQNGWKKLNIRKMILRDIFVVGISLIVGYLVGVLL